MAVASDQAPGEEGRRRRRRRSWGQRLAITLGCVCVIGLGASAAGLGYIYRKYERLPRVELSGVLDEPTGSGEPENYLIVGIDSAENLAADDPVRIGRGTDLRSDTIMILRVDPQADTARMLSLPRDLWVPIAGTDTHRKINAAVRIGGAPLLIRTIDENFGIDIHHYVQVDFAAFQGLVDAIGGVPIYFPYPARDEKTGLDIAQSGCVHLDPTQALAFVRSRTYEEEIDGTWLVDRNLPDLGRIDRQQAFIRRALSRAIDRGARNPATLDQLIDVGLQGITVDDELTAGDIFDLGRRFRSFDPEKLETYSMDAAVSAARVGDADVLMLDPAKAAPVFDLFRTPQAGGPVGGSGDVPPAPPALEPSSVALTVLNGTGRPREATNAGAALESVGFVVQRLGDDPVQGRDRTEVRYPPGQQAAAAVVDRWLVSGADLVEQPGAAGVTVVTGADWAGLRSQPAAGPSGEGGGQAQAGGGSSTSAPTTTSSTVPAAREC